MDSEYRSELLLREIDARGRAEGEARGKAQGKAEGGARAVLVVLDTRGVHVPDAVRDRSSPAPISVDSTRGCATAASAADDVIQP
jgi:hypothetical protein